MASSHPHGAQAPDAEILDEPPALRRLRLLVMVLIVVLIFGVLTVVATIVIRLGALEIDGGATPLAPVTAEAISLPPGQEVQAVGRAGDEILIITRDGAGRETLRRHGAGDGVLLSVIPIERAPDPAE